MKNLGDRSLTAVFWGGGGAIFKILLQFGTMVALARILGPEQYGVFAIGAIVVSFSSFFSDFGIAYGLIQKEQVSSQDLRFVITWQLITGLAVTLVVLLASSNLAEFFGDARAASVISALAAVCILNAVAAPSLNMLKRSLDFRSIQIAQIVAYLAGFVAVGLPLALAGFMFWALVAAWLVQAMVTLLILYSRTRHPLRPLIWFEGAGALLQYGTTVLATNLVNWTIGNIDRVVVARAFASKDVGLYSSAYNMLYNPTAALLGVLQPVFFSASVRISDEKSRISAAYVALLSCIAVFILPIFAGLSAVATTFVLTLYGSSWREAGAILSPVALVMPLFLAWGLTTPLVWAGGQPGREWKIQLPLALLWIGTTWAAAQVSTAAVGWAVAGLALIRFLLMLAMAMRLLQMNARYIWQSVQGGLILALACALAMRAIDHWMTVATDEAPAVRLAAAMLVGAATMLAGLLAFPGLLAKDANPIIAKIVKKLPAPLANLLTTLLLRRQP